MKKVTKWTRIGSVAVDAGMIWIGDPCYVLHKGEPDNPPYPEVGKSWQDFCRIFSNATTRLGKDHATLGGKDGDRGIGVCVATPYGDGVYDVYAKMDGARILELKIRLV